MGSFWTGFKIVLTLAWPSHFVLISSAEQLRPVPGARGSVGRQVCAEGGRGFPGWKS